MFNGQVLDVKTSLVHSQLGNYYSYLYYQSPGHLLPHSEGWELLLVNVGKYPDDQTNLEAVVFRALPYVVLYNKYSGVIRVFVGMGPDATISESAHALSVKLRFNNQAGTNYFNGLLRYYDGHDSPLDQPINTQNALSVGKTITEGVRWASVDFQTAYDPCSCNTPTKLNLEFTHIKEHELKLIGREVAITDTDIMTNEMGVTPRDFLSSVSYDETTKNASQGLAINKALQNTLDDYEKRYKKYQDDLAANQERNEFVNKNLGYIKFAKYAIATVQTLSGGFSSGILPVLLKYAGAQYAIDYLASTNYNSYSYSEDTDWFKSTVKSFPNLIKKINSNEEKIDETEFYKFLKILMGKDAETFIANNLETTTDPNQPAKPTNTITYSEMNFDGKIVTQGIKIGPTFYSPGSYGPTRASWDSQLDGNNAFLFPVYNELLGTFALMETPKIAISKLTPANQTNVILQNNYRVAPDVDLYRCALYRHQTWSKQYQIKLLEPLKYAFNNTLDIKEYKINANFEIKARPKLLEAGDVIHTNAFLLKNEVINLDPKNVDSDPALPVVSMGNPYYDQVNSLSPTFNFNVSPTTGALTPGATVHETEIKFTSPTVPLDAFAPIVTQFSLRNEVISARFLGSHSTNTLDDLNISWLPNGNIYFNNLNQLINLPGVYNGGSHLPAVSDPATYGYEFDFDVQLKLSIDITFNSTNTVGANNTATMVVTYPIKVDPTTFTNQQIPVVNVGQYPENLNLGNINFDGNPVTGCVLNGNQYVCRAWNNVVITDDITTSNGYHALITGGNEVEVVPDADLMPEIVLAVEPILDYSMPMPESSDTYVKNFCSGQNPNASSYRANTASKSLQMINTPANEVSEVELENVEFDAQLFPNPTTGNVNISLTNEVTSIHVIISEISGKKLQELNFSNTQSAQLNLSGYAQGTYLITVVTEEGSVTKQLMKR